MTDRYRIAMAHQACEVADLAGLAVTLTDRDRAVAQALEVMKAAHGLLDAALAYSGHPRRSFALEHPDEAAEDIADWLRRHAEETGAEGNEPGQLAAVIRAQSADHVHGEGRGPSPSTHS